MRNVMPPIKRRSGFPYLRDAQGAPERLAGVQFAMRNAMPSIYGRPGRLYLRHA